MTRPFAPGFRIPPDLLLRAYATGVFPMAEHAEDREVFWVRPETRGIVPLNAFHVPRSLKKAIRKASYEIRYDHDFAGVIDACATVGPERNDTWINEPIREAYTELFERGHCHTVEAWKDDRLVGGLYGVALGRAFFGESMFSREPNASKICLFHLVQRLKEHDFELLDTQFTTEHLKQFGAVDVPRRQYERLLAEALEGTATF